MIFNTADKPHLNTMANYCQSTTYFQKSFQRVAEGSVYKDLFHLAETVVSILLIRFLFGPTSGQMHELQTYIRSHDSGAHVFWCKSNFVSGPWVLCSF